MPFTTTGIGNGRAYLSLNAATAYIPHSVRLTSHIGQSVTITITGVEDSIDQTAFAVDDTAVQVS